MRGVPLETPFISLFLHGTGSEERDMPCCAVWRYNLVVSGWVVCSASPHVGPVEGKA